MPGSDDGLSIHSGDSLFFDDEDVNNGQSYNLEDSYRDSRHTNGSQGAGQQESFKPESDPFADPVRVLGLVLVTLSGLAASLYFVKSTVKNKSEFLGSGTYDASMLIDVLTETCAFVTGMASAGIVKMHDNARGPIFAAAWYVHRAYVIVEGLEWTTGFGPPYEGDSLHVGSQQFTAVHDQLQSAFPNNDHWRGSAPGAYADQLTTLQDCLTELANCDRDLKNLIANQAEWALAVRLTLGLIKCLLCITATYLTYAVLRYLNTPEEWRFFQATKIAKWIARIAPGVGALAVIILLSASSDKYKAITRVKDRYNNIAPEGAGIIPSPNIAAVSGTGVGEFGDLPSIAELAELAGFAGGAAPAAPHSLFSAHLGDGAAANSTSSQATPTSARLTAMSEQTAQFLEAAGPYMDLIGQATAYQPQATSSVPETPRGNAPAERPCPPEDAPLSTNPGEIAPAGAQAGNSGHSAPVGVTEAETEYRYTAMF